MFARKESCRLFEYSDVSIPASSHLIPVGAGELLNASRTHFGLDSAELAGYQQGDQQLRTILLVPARSRTHRQSVGPISASQSCCGH